MAVALGQDGQWLREAGGDVQRHTPGARGAYLTTGGRRDDLPELHQLVRAAATVSTGALRDACTLSSRVSVEHAAAAVSSAHTAQDVVAGLPAHDAARGTDLARTLLTWLDHHGDVAGAAQLTIVHVNTFRHRLRKAAALVTADLDDPDVRLDVHLRLRRVLRPAARRFREPAGAGMQSSPRAAEATASAAERSAADDPAQRCRCARHDAGRAARHVPDRGHECRAVAVGA